MVPSDTAVVGFDVFDDRVILGNAPPLAERNVRRAGVSPGIVAGDAPRLPLATDSVDVVTACRVLHDLPREDAERTLAECRRVLRAAGRLGVLELPIPHDEDAEPMTYWRATIEAAGFDVRSATRLDYPYFVFTAVPECGGASVRAAAREGSVRAPRRPGNEWISTYHVLRVTAEPRAVRHGIPRAACHG